MENIKENAANSAKNVVYVLLQDGRPFFDVLDPSLIGSLIFDRKKRFPGSSFSVERVVTESFDYESA